MAKKVKKVKADKDGMVQISIALPPDDIAFLDEQAQANGRTRAGQARFFLNQVRSTAMYGKAE